MSVIEAIEHWVRIGGFVAFLVLFPCALTWWLIARRRAHADYLRRKRAADPIEAVGKFEPAIKAYAEQVNPPR